MAYTALYRRFRPRFFDEVVGQEHIIPILKNQVAKKRISHAYLFCGTRGTGKTSTAQILARAIRCENPAGGEPCAACDVCMTGDETGGTVDIIEIDAASNNSVDEVRELREKVRLSPVTGRYKVYIVDEVHMLSAGAFNALLKTLEEPPKHVVFILATTEVHKLPATIVSRCQRFDFKRVSVESMINRLEHVLDALNMQADREALTAIARMAQGGMRDALGLLDQCIAAGKDALTKPDVLNVLGGADDLQLKHMADAVIARDAGAALQSLQGALDAGRDLGVLMRDFMQYFRQLMLLSICGDSFDLTELTPEMQSIMHNQAQEAGTAFILRALDILARLEGDMRYSVSARALSEAAMVRLCADRQDDAPAALLARIEALEKRLEGMTLATQPALPAQGEGAAVVQPPKASGPTVQKEKAAPVKKKPQQGQPQKDNGEELFNRLLPVVKKERMPLYIVLRDGKPLSFKDDVLTVQFSEKNALYAQVVNQEENKAYITSTLMNLASRPVVFKTAVGDVPLGTVESGPAEKGTQAKHGNSTLLDEAIALFGEENVRVMEE
ncbi:MAG: DNA polymerase III subunit gamma/tau [Bacillota bacterium]